MRKYKSTRKLFPDYVLEDSLIKSGQVKVGFTTYMRKEFEGVWYDILLRSDYLLKDDKFFAMNLHETVKRFILSSWFSYNLTDLNRKFLDTEMGKGTILKSEIQVTEKEYLSDIVQSLLKSN